MLLGCWTSSRGSYVAQVSCNRCIVVVTTSGSGDVCSRFEHPTEVSTLSCTENGSLYVGLNNGAVFCWDIVSGLKRWSTNDNDNEEHRDSNGVTCLAVVQRDGEPIVVSGSYDKTVRAWSLEGKQLWSTNDNDNEEHRHSNGVTCLAVVQRDGEPIVVSGSRDKTVRAWSLEGKQLWSTNDNDNEEHRHSDWIYCLAVVQRDGKPIVVSGSFDQTVRAWSLEGKQLWSTNDNDNEEHRHSGYVTCLAVVQRDGEPIVVSGSSDKTVRAWSLEGKQLWSTNDKNKRAHHHSTRISAIMGPTKGRVWSADADGNVVLWRAADGAPLRCFKRDPIFSAITFKLKGSTSALVLGTGVGSVVHVTLGGVLGALGVLPLVECGKDDMKLAPVRWLARNEVALGFFSKAISLVIVYLQFLSFAFGSVSTPKVYEPVAESLSVLSDFGLKPLHYSSLLYVACCFIALMWIGFYLQEKLQFASFSASENSKLVIAFALVRALYALASGVLLVPLTKVLVEAFSCTDDRGRFFGKQSSNGAQACAFVERRMNATKKIPYYVMNADGGETRCWDTTEHWLGMAVWAFLALFAMVVMATRLERVDNDLTHIEAGGNLLTAPLKGWDKDITVQKSFAVLHPLSPSSSASVNAKVKVFVTVVLSVSMVLFSKTFGGVLFSVVSVLANCLLLWADWKYPSFAPSFPVEQSAANLRQVTGNKVRLAASGALATASVCQLIFAGLSFAQTAVVDCEAIFVHPATVALQLSPLLVIGFALFHGVCGNYCRHCVFRNRLHKVSPEL